jgi:hypothetical protein
MEVTRYLRDQVIYKHSSLTLDHCFFKPRTSASKECVRELQAKNVLENFKSSFVWGAMENCTPYGVAPEP